MTVHAQRFNQGSLSIELYQNDLSYTTDSTRNDYYRESRIKHDYYKFVHDADSSYMVVAEEIIPFYLPNEGPSFQGRYPSEFCRWICERIFNLLEKKKKHTFWLTVDFIVSESGKVEDVRVDPYQSDKEHTSLDESILAIIKGSPKWKPEHHYYKRYCTPFSLHISSNHYVKGRGVVVLSQYDHGYYQRLYYEMWKDSPERAQREVIPDYQIASDEDIDEKAHLEDESVNLNQWIKSNIQDVTEMVGFGDGETEIELIISANGWVSKATVIKSYDKLLGEHLADLLLTSCPRWVPAKVNGISVPSKVRITYSWRFLEKMAVPSSINSRDSLDRVTWNYEDVDVKPTFQKDSTLLSFHNWVDANLYLPKDQPDASGRIIADFDIMPDGTLSNVVITRGPCESINQMVWDVLLKSPKWEPGRKNNKPCVTRITGFQTLWMLR